MILLAIAETTSYRRKVRGAEKSECGQTIKAEYDFLVNNATRDLVPYEHIKKVTRSSWKFKLKRDGDGNIAKYKARLVARGD